MKISNHITRYLEIDEALDILTDLYHLALAHDLVTTDDEKILVIRSLDLIKNTLRFANVIPSNQQSPVKVVNQFEDSENNYIMRGDSFWVKKSDGSEMRMMKYFKDNHQELCKLFPSANSHRVKKLLVDEKKYVAIRQGNKIILHPPVK